MNSDTTQTRRHLLKTSALTATAFLNPFGSYSIAGEPTTPEIAIFTKSFQSWTLEKVCQKFADLALTGLDLTVRPGGHIAPEEAKQKLPEAAKIAADHGLKILQITSSITRPDSASTTLFETAGKLGIQKIKLGYYQSNVNSPITEQLIAVNKQLTDLIAVGKQTGTLPCVHIHSGNYLPSHGTMLYLLLQDFAPGDIGAYVDTLHMSLEGGSGGWLQGLQLLAPWIQLCSVKNYRLLEQSRDRIGQLQWKWETCPLADGVSPLPRFIDTLKQLGYRGPYSLHSEYLPKLSVEQCYEQTAADLNYLRRLL